MLAIRLPLEIENRLEALSKATGRTKTYYAREAILEYIDDLEDLYLAQHRYADWKAGKSESVPLEAAMKSFGFEVDSDGKVVEKQK